MNICTFLKFGAALLATLLIVEFSFAADSTASFDGLDGKIFVGYQGWFRCPGDGGRESFASGGWFKDKIDENDRASTRQWLVDQLPDVSEIPASARCRVPKLNLNYPNYEVFSSLSPEVVDVHFRWMEKYRVDGAMVQRFINQLDRLSYENDKVLSNIVSSSAKYRRSFLIEYDLSYATDEDIKRRIFTDFSNLENRFGLSKLKNYQKVGGKPVVSIWGLGFGDGHHVNDPKLALEIISWFKARGFVVIGGVPAYWATLSRDSFANSAWNKVYSSLDIVQPWTVGRYKSTLDYLKWASLMYPRDLRVVALNRQKYMPVIFPGFSRHNRVSSEMSNLIPRGDGDFLMTQAKVLRAYGISFLKIAMFDEFNEATAIIPTVNELAALPEEGRWIVDEGDSSKTSYYYLGLVGRIKDIFNRD